MDNYWQWLADARESKDKHQLTVGMVVARMRSQNGYGDAAVLGMAKEANWRPSTLWEYARVYRFVMDLRSAGILKTMPRRIFEQYPILSYTHLRVASSIDDFEDAVEALLTALDEGMNAGQFSVHVKEVYKGGKAYGKPLYDQAGKGQTIFEGMRQLIPGWLNRSLRVKVWEVD